MIVWEKSLETGNLELDLEHQNIIKTFNISCDIFSQPKAPDSIPDFMLFLTSFVTDHFSHEEHLMLVNRYPDYENHKKAHNHFRMTVIQWHESHTDRKITLSEIMAFLGTVEKWLSYHLSKTDMKLAAYMKQIS